MNSQTRAVVVAIVSSTATKRIQGGPRTRGALGPCDQQLTFNAGPDVVSCQRERLAQVERRRELANRVLAYEDFRRRCRIFQPPRQRLFARARAGDGQQLEERAAAEEIEVVGVKVFVVAKAIARLPLPIQESARRASPRS